MFLFSSCHRADTPWSHESSLSHGQPDMRQSDAKKGLGWQRYVLGPPPLFPQRQVPDNIWKGPLAWLHPALTELKTGVEKAVNKLQTWLSLTVNVRVLKSSKLIGSSDLIPGIVWGADTSAINTEHLEQTQQRETETYQQNPENRHLCWGHSLERRTRGEKKIWRASVFLPETEFNCKLP